MDSFEFQVPFSGNFLPCASSSVVLECHFIYKNDDYTFFFSIFQADLLQLYTFYVQDFPSSLNMIRKYYRQSSKFRKFLKVIIVLQ